jgi:hypothetical protein
MAAVAVSARANKTLSSNAEDDGTGTSPCPEETVKNRETFVGSGSTSGGRDVAKGTACGPKEAVNQKKLPNAGAIPANSATPTKDRSKDPFGPSDLRTRAVTIRDVRDAAEGTAAIWRLGLTGLADTQ